MNAFLSALIIVMAMLVSVVCVITCAAVYISIAEGVVIYWAEPFIIVTCIVSIYGLSLLFKVTNTVEG